MQGSSNEYRPEGSISFLEGKVKEFKERERAGKGRRSCECKDPEAALSLVCLKKTAREPVWLEWKEQEGNYRK